MVPAIPVTAATILHSTIQTRDSLAVDFARLDLRRGDTVLLHASMRRLGWVCGGATAVVQALLDVIGAAGTLVVPAQTPFNRDPATWRNPTVPPSLWEHVRQQLPAFQADLSPSEGMGAVAERVRTWPGAGRSNHPITSFAAVGPRAGRLLARHDLDSQLGERSPLASLETAQARILLLGVGFDRCTAFHLAEYRLPRQRVRRYSCAVLDEGRRRWVSYDGIALNAADFGALGAAFEAQTGLVRVGTVGMATGRLLPLRAAVEFATRWLETTRR
jgi:aminoglycoside 3-N-acetyltransferase